jgi:hypothetical protein
LALFTKYKAFFSTFRTPHRNPASLQAIPSSSHPPPRPSPRAPSAQRTDPIGGGSISESPRITNPERPLLASFCKIRYSKRLVFGRAPRAGTSAPGSSAANTGS